MTGLGSIMAAAGAAQREQPNVLLPSISTDPLDELVDRVRPKVGRAVDALQVAAVLESDGLTDRGARVEYGYADVFATALEVYRRLGPTLDPPAPAVPRERSWDGWRLVLHGPLYALPSAVFPAAMAVLGRRSLVLALVCASGLGWVYAGVIGHAAYRLLGAGKPGAAARTLRWSTLAAPVTGALAGLLVVLVAGGGPGLVVLVAAQLAYQLASTVLVFYRREWWLAVAMMPAVATGIGFLVAGTGWRTAAVVVALGSVATASGLALIATGGRGADTGRAWEPALAGVGAYAVCSAVMLLHAGAPYLLGRLDLAIAVAPLIVSMGFVEWRAERFRATAVTLTRHVDRPDAFVRRIRRTLFGEAAVCLVVCAAVAAVQLGVFHLAGALSPAGALMTAAHVALAAVYYLAFLLAGRGRYVLLCAAMLTAVAVHVGLSALLDAAPLTDATLFLGSVLLLQVLVGLGLAPLVGQIRHYR